MDALKALQALPGHVGYVYQPLDGTMGESFHPDDPIEAASVIKLPIMVEAFRQREAGTLDFAAPVVIRKEDKLPSCGALTYLHDGITVTVGDLVTLMIILSDNTATNLLIDRLGQENINATIGALGLTHTRLNRKLFQSELASQGIRNVVSAGDMAQLLAGIYRGEVVSQAASHEMLTILSNQRLNGKLPFYLHSKGIQVAHKTGEDDGITHDVGIVFGEHPFILCVLTEKTDVPAAECAMQEAALQCAT